MSKRQVLIIIGILVALIPFLGFPSTWDQIITLVLGFIIIAVAYRIKPGVSSRPPRDMSYIEHKNKPIQSNDTTPIVGNEITNSPSEHP